MSTQREDYLQKQQEKTKDPKLSEIWHQLEEFHSKKQWHQLTNAVKDALSQEEFISKTDLLEFYNNFVDEFSHRVNPLSLVEIAIPICKWIKASPNKENTIPFLEKLKPLIKNDQQAVILCNATVAGVKLEMKDDRGRCPHIPDIRNLLEETEKNLDELEGVSTVHGEFHKVKSHYLREVGDFGGYYQEALRYLGCIDIEKMDSKEKTMQAFCLGLAALLGEEVYNFGELLAHPVLDSLKDTDERWMIDLLRAFNKGDHGTCASLRKQWAAWDDLKKHEEFLLQKLRILAVMELSFSRPSKERAIPFEEIAKAGNVSNENVEKLVMKTLSKGLVKGQIDQVDQKVTFTWVQPRVLDKSQIAKMAQRFGDWNESVKEMEMLVGSEAEEILIR